MLFVYLIKLLVNRTFNRKSFSVLFSVYYSFYYFSSINILNKFLFEFLNFEFSTFSYLLFFISKIRNCLLSILLIKNILIFMATLSMNGKNVRNLRRQSLRSSISLRKRDMCLLNIFMNKKIIILYYTVRKKIIFFNFANSEIFFWEKY